MSSAFVVTLVPMILGVAIGFGLPMQTAINSQLRSLLRSPFKASLVSFAVGTAALWIIVALGEGDAGLSTGFVESEPWWIWLGGVLGVVFLTGNILMFPKLGAVQTVVMPILGQIIASNAIDIGGWFGLPVHHMTMMRAFGIVLAVVGIVLAVVIPDIYSARSRAESSTRSTHVSGRPLWQCIGILLGALSAGQTAINGHLGSELGSATHAAFISFAIGLLLLVLIVIAQESFSGARSHATSHGSRASASASAENKDSGVLSLSQRVSALVSSPWWFWVGGLLGAAFVFGNSYLAPVLGTGLTVVIVLLGQICGGLAVDQFGLLRAHKRRVTALQMIGVAVLLTGAIIIRMF